MRYALALALVLALLIAIWALLGVSRCGDFPPLRIGSVLLAGC